MLFIGVLQLLTFLANTLLGVSVLVRNAKSNENRAFAVVAFATAGWILSLYLMIFTGLDTLLVGRIAFVFGSSMLAALLWFVSEFPERYKRSTLIRRLAIALGTFFFVLSLSPYMILSAEIRNADGIAYIWGSFGSPYSAWLLFYVFSVGYTFFHAWLRVRKTHGIKRRQYRALAIGLTSFYLPMVITQIILPATGQFQWNSLGPVFSIFALIFVAQSMLSYRVFNVRWVFKWGLVIPVIISFIVGLIAFAVFLLTPVLNATYATLITAGILTISYQPLFHLVDRIVSRILGRGSYVFDNAVLEISRLSQEHLDLAKLHGRLGKHLEKYFHLERYAIITFVPNKTSILNDRIVGFARGLRDDVPRIVQASREYDMEIVEKDELVWRLKYQLSPADEKRDQNMRDLLQRWEIDSVIPLSINGKLVGLLLLGPKSSKEPLDNEDRRLLEVIKGTVTPTFANAARFEAMKLLYEELQEADKIKSEFIDVVSHQFRTPLTAILWDAELALDQKPKPVSVRESLTDIKQRANFIRTILLQMFDLLELQNKKMRFRPETIPLDTFVQNFVKKNAALCKEKSLVMEMHLEPVSAKADPRHLSAVLERVVENACVYSHLKGKITIETGIDKKADAAFIKIEDHGIGMSRTIVKNLFKKFYRGTEAKKEKPDGTGLSLYLANEVTRLMHGTIIAESKEGKGSAFTIKLPLA